MGSSEEEWRKLGGGDPRLTSSLMRLYRLFKQAPILGSLIDPTPDKDIVIDQASFDELELLLDMVLATAKDDELTAMGVAAEGLGHAAKILAGKYYLVATNVPYLARGKHEDTLRGFCEDRFPEAKNDLTTAFLDRCLQLCNRAGTVSIVLPQNWLFLTTYRKFREKLLREDTWHLIARLGEGGFDSPQAAGAFTILITLSRGQEK